MKSNGITAILPQEEMAKINVPDTFILAFSSCGKMVESLQHPVSLLQGWKQQWRTVTELRPKINFYDI